MGMAVVEQVVAAEEAALEMAAAVEVVAAVDMAEAVDVVREVHAVGEEMGEVVAAAKAQEAWATAVVAVPALARVVVTAVLEAYRVETVAPVVVAVTAVVMVGMETLVDSAAETMEGGMVVVVAELRVVAEANAEESAEVLVASREVHVAPKLRPASCGRRKTHRRCCRPSRYTEIRTAVRRRRRLCNLRCKWQETNSRLHSCRTTSLSRSAGASCHHGHDATILMSQGSGLPQQRYHA